ncbi:hypothetical protein HanRHA438_Chr05g0244721 [Helianthus annuus]|nr:hypothetical protein HanOQP8_Chr05g0202411 [Helianthus annuus]KAJ0748559.1 hypothetical protein HanOQP8_Chr05g0202461 [Helianthus annuus]KAJ0920742.1 hypothetical protein HanRHA438_Chr05g0244671 [Helianthus annuus]KAJ0920747.1 hypothetical protein HanRHA438_Chr05g0244721 [Helianthus annuus]KAJ0924352.1 hypothetical protein HanPSC8_Chr05g0227181 [Helianthus annuus]
MAGLFDKQAEAYLDARPTYPGDWYSMLAHQTSSLSLAWDVGTGNGYWCSGALLASDRDRHQRSSTETIPYWNQKIKYLSDGYQTLPFPFDTDSIGLGSEGSPLKLDMPKDLSFEGFFGMLNSWSSVVTAREREGLSCWLKMWSYNFNMCGADPTWLGLLCTKLSCLQEKFALN